MEASKPYVFYVGFFRRPSTGKITPYFADTHLGSDAEAGGVTVRIEIDADKLNALFAPVEVSTFSGNVTAVDE